MSLICRLARVDPLVVDVDGLGEEVDGRLEVLHADGALDPPRVLRLLHLHLAGLLVVAERTVEHGVQGLDGLALGAGTALRLSATHDDEVELFEVLGPFDRQTQTETEPKTARFL